VNLYLILRQHDTHNCAVIAQLGERKTEDLKAPCSIHGHGTGCSVAQRKRIGLITQGSMDRNHPEQLFSSTLLALVLSLIAQH
jgi:hypothetical protein